VRNAYSFAKAVLRHWGSLLTSGLAVAALEVWEHLAQRPVSARLYGLIAFGGVIVACYKAWLEQTIRAENADKSLSETLSTKPNDTEIAELQRALASVRDDTQHWAKRLGAWGTLPRNATPKLTPDRWQPALQIAAKLGTTLHGDLLQLEGVCRDAEREIADLCALPESYRLARQGQINRTIGILSNASKCASVALDATTKLADQ